MPAATTRPCSRSTRAGSRPPGHGAKNELAGWIGLAGPYEFLPLDPGPSRPVFFHPDYPPGMQPVDHVAGDAPPAFLAAPTNDKVVSPQRSTLALATRLRAAGVPVRLEMYDGITHALLVGLRPAAARAGAGARRRRAIRYRGDAALKDPRGFFPGTTVPLRAGGAATAFARSCTVRDFEENTMADKTGAGDKPRAAIPQTKRTGQKRSLERGKSTRKKNPGKRAHKGG